LKNLREVFLGIFGFASSRSIVGLSAGHLGNCPQEEASQTAKAEPNEPNSDAGTKS
jgi:hypothetical protein